MRVWYWLLNKIFHFIYWWGIHVETYTNGAKIMYWIIQHTPADENETK